MWNAFDLTKAIKNTLEEKNELDSFHLSNPKIST
jgi:hypothetical protein